MLSKRDFLAIVLMMLALFFIFQFSQVIKAQGNNYDVNEYAGDSAEGKVTEVAAALNTHSAKDAVNREFAGVVWYVGDTASNTAKAVEQWCYYRNYRVVYYEDVPKPVENYQLKMIVFDTAGINLEKRTGKVKKLAETMGVPMVFSGLPEPEVIRRSSNVRTLLGISEVKADSVKTEGIQIFKGFLLGGETVFKASGSEEKKYEDLELNMPWYATGLGTKTYMVALMDEEEVSPYDFPKIIWRNYHHGAFVYAVNGDYINGNMGLGFLDAFMYEASDYELHPVANANIVSLTDFPYLANENDEKMKRTYSRDVEATLRDVAWPGFVSMASRSDLRLTSFFTTKYDYGDSSEPNGKYVEFYLQQLKEVSAEAGKSMAFKGNKSLDEKIKEDNEFYRNLGINYNFRTLFFRSFNKSMVNSIKASGFENGSIISVEADDDCILKYVSDRITRQAVTAQCDRYSFKSNLLQKSILTSIGYSNVLINMNNVVWPESIADEWQNYFDLVYSNMTTYWSKTCGMDKATASESDARIRKMMACSYSIKADETNPLKLTVEMSGTSDCWFILRTHNAALDKMSDGEYRELEEFVYLLHVKEGTTEIILDDTDDVFRYRTPFD